MCFFFLFRSLTHLFDFFFLFLSLDHADIVFFIYLYQRWIYRVDPKRVNEFGTSGEDANVQGAVAGENSVADPSISHDELASPPPEEPSVNDSQKTFSEKKND